MPAKRKHAKHTRHTANSPPPRYSFHYGRVASYGDYGDDNAKPTSEPVKEGHVCYLYAKPLAAESYSHCQPAVATKYLMFL